MAVHSLPALLPLVVPIAASTFVTALISGTFGMAGGMILMAVLLQLLPLAVAQTLHAAVQLVSNGWRCWLWRKHIVWRVLPFYAFGAAFGFSLVVTLKFVPDKAAVLMMIGVVPLISMAVRKVLVLTIMNRGHAFIAAAILTFVHMTGGVVGALLDLLYNNTGLTRHQIIATKAFTQTSSHILRLAYFGTLVSVLTGKTVWPEGLGIVEIAFCLAMAIAGTTSATFLLHRLSDHNFKHYSRYVIAAVSFYCLGQGAYIIASG